MRILHVDGSAGASGDMILGALVDLGVPLSKLRRGLAALPLSGYRLSSRRLLRAGLAGCKVDVKVRGHEHGRRWKELDTLLSAERLPETVRRRAKRIFRRLIEAEAEVHGTTPGRVHLHEAGATDAVVDIVGACIGLEYLRVDRLIVGPLTTGFGLIHCEHGDYPVPAPATASLLRNIPIRAGTIEFERLTPTGAAILTTLADGWGPLPAMWPRAIGYGAGDRDLGGTPNMLRMTLGDAEVPALDPGSADPEIIVIECSVDDTTPQALAFAAERLFAAGALDVFTSAITMKKGRSGHTLTVLARPESSRQLAQLLLRETGSLGLRMRSERRIELARHVVDARTPWGRVRVKLGQLDGETTQAWPEYEDCAGIAVRQRIPLGRVQRAALASLALDPPHTRRPRVRAAVTTHPKKSPKENRRRG